MLRRDLRVKGKHSGGARKRSKVGIPPRDSSASSAARVPSKRLSKVIERWSCLECSFRGGSAPFPSKFRGIEFIARREGEAVDLFKLIFLNVVDRENFLSSYSLAGFFPLEFPFEIATEENIWKIWISREINRRIILPSRVTRMRIDRYFLRRRRREGTRM